LLRRVGRNLACCARRNSSKFNKNSRIAVPSRRGTKNADQVSMAICCGQCGATNNSRNRLCLTCGADLLESPEQLTLRPMSPQQPTQPPVRGSSIVRSTAEPTNSVSYPFQDEVRASHVGRYFVLAFFSLTVASAGWHWQDLRMLASRFSKSPAISQSKVTSSTPAQGSVSPAEMLTPQSAHPEPSELASQRGRSATEETSSRDPSQEVSVAALGSSKAQIQPVSASTRGRITSETEGEKYLYGDGVPVNCDRARQDLLAAAELSSTAQSALGTMYATGHCAIRDLPLAYRWFARAQRQNPHNRIIEEDMRVLWDQMSTEERNLAKQ
jgi:hypothetical protein